MASSTRTPMLEASRVHIMAADGTGDRVGRRAPRDRVRRDVGLVESIPSGSSWSAGMRTDQSVEETAVVPIDGTGASVKLVCPTSATGPAAMAWSWSPDDDVAARRPRDGLAVGPPPPRRSRHGQVTVTMPWSAQGEGSWQRVGPYAHAIDASTSARKGTGNLPGRRQRRRLSSAATVVAPEAERRLVDQHGLVDRARRGDRQAFAELVRASGARLDATARLILRDPELAQDAVQETLIRAWRSLPGLRDPATFDHWLHSLVAHACIDLIRKRRRRVIEVDLADINDPPAPDSVGQIADRDLLDRALARLEPEARAVVVLHLYLDMPLPRVAATLGIPIGTAKSRLHRSLGAMRSAVSIEEVTSVGAAALGGPVA